MVDNCRIKEIRSSGNWLSWAGWRDKIWVQCRLDRSFGNDEWFRIFPRAHMEYGDMRASDHRPITISFVREERDTRRGRFMFDKRMVAQAGVEDIVKLGWGDDQKENTTPLMERIRRCRFELSKWKRITKMGSRGKIARLKTALEKEISKRMPCAARMHRLKRDLAKAHRDEEAFWRQRSRKLWLKLGDRNTRYFHNCAKSRKLRNRILMLLDTDGREHFSEGSKGHIAAEYFRDIFSSSNPWDLETLFDGFASKVTEEMNTMLTSPILEEEVKQAAFNIKGSSAPGADGLTGVFYKKFWSIVGPSTTREVQKFFQTAVLPSDWNHTQI